MHRKIPKTGELQQALEETQGGPVHVVDADGRVTHVIIAADLYQRVQALVGEQEVDVREMCEAQEGAFASAWEDPALDIYNDDRDRRP